MRIRLHENATTTPAIRRTIQSSNLPVRRLAWELGVWEDTIRRGNEYRRRRSSAYGAAPADELDPPFQAAVVVDLRKLLRLPLDDLLAVVRNVITPNVSRPGRESLPASSRTRFAEAIAAQSKPHHPQTNGRVEHLNGHISKVLAIHRASTAGKHSKRRFSATSGGTITTSPRKPSHMPPPSKP